MSATVPEQLMSSVGRSTAVVPQCHCRGFPPGVSVAVWSDALGAGLKRNEGLAPLDGTVGGSGEAAGARFHGLVAVAESSKGTYVVAIAGSFAQG